jgi:[acyl-carrier-protein] S-malonyltransferase
VSTAFIFPGQGSQHVGMGKDVVLAFPEARHALEEAEESLKLDLRAIMFEGPEDMLRQTEFAQPALMAVSLAIFRVLERQGNVKARENPVFYAGHSLGEYSALCAAGSLSLPETATLLRIRGQAMQQSVPVGEGGMLALLGATPEQAEDVARQAVKRAGGVCEMANDNGGGQCVLSGHNKTVKAAEEIAKEAGIKKAVPLPVSAPFHCSLMAPAADVMKDALSQATWKRPERPIVANVSATEESDPEALAELLVKQVTARVRWRESVLYMGGRGVNRYVEIGAGNVLCGLVKRIDREAEAFPIRNCGDLDAYLNKQAA